tara:strand:- start:355 stop:585 length:231 start_codon:yes stop_codon:yes gene_type:complete
MGRKAIERRLKRQGQKGAIKPRTLQRYLNKMRIGPPEMPEPVTTPTLQVNSGGKVELFQDQIMKKFNGGRIKTKQK